MVIELLLDDSLTNMPLLLQTLTSSDSRYPHSADENTEVQRPCALGPWSHNQKVVER